MNKVCNFSDLIILYEWKVNYNEVRNIKLVTNSETNNISFMILILLFIMPKNAVNKIKISGERTRLTMKIYVEMVYKDGNFKKFK